MTELLSDADLDRLEALAEGATPGPWERVTSQRIDGPDYAEVICPGRVECMAHCYGGSSTIEGDNLDADLEFIAFARDALPRALAELRVLRERVAEALEIEAWPYNPATMTGFELDQADGYNDARREFRRALGVVSDD